LTRAKRRVVWWRYSYWKMPTKIDLSMAILLVPSKVYKEKQWKDFEFISTFTHIYILWQNTTVISWPFQHMSVKWLINFEIFNFNKWNIPQYSLFSFTTFSDLEEIIFESFNIYENNTISVELAKVLRYCCANQWNQSNGFRISPRMGYVQQQFLPLQKWLRFLLCAKVFRILAGVFFLYNMICESGKGLALWYTWLLM
jgi:hypothetical protein